ncbi:MAG: hypothetical protein FIB06_03765 [Betaproteobacteria bacterium]|nr:hypothetical protein [Betaproteobacteria bacterium]
MDPEGTPPVPALLAAPFTGASREIDAGACFDWLRAGWQAFMVNPGAWIGASVLFIVIMYAVNVVLGFGQLAFLLLLPVFAGGMVCMCDRQHKGGQAEIADLFAGFRHNAGSLVMVGFWYMIGITAVGIFVFALVTTGIIGGAITGSVAGFTVAITSGVIGGVLAFVLIVPIIMAAWFAPFLVFLHDMAPWPAMQASFAAGAKNPVLTFVFGLIVIIGLVFAAASLLLGLLLFVPVISNAAYASYRDIFTEA